MYIEMAFISGFVLALGIFIVLSYVLREKSSFSKWIVTLCVWTTPPFLPRTEKRALSIGFFAIVVGLGSLLLVLYAAKTGIKIGPTPP